MKAKFQQLVLLLFTLLLTRLCVAGDFELVKSGQQIRLYERWIPHNGNTVRELKADFFVKDVSAEAVIALLKSASKGPRWNANARSYKIVNTTNESVWFTYVRYKIPWPMDDQDCSLKYSFDKRELHKPVCHVYFEGAATWKFPPVENVTRITGTKGKWTLEKGKDGRLHISYQIVTDKSASVPRWVSDPIIHDNLFKTISAFRSLLQQSS